MGSIPAFACALPSWQTPFFQSVPNKKIDASYILEVQVVSVDRGALADLPPPDGGWPKGRRLESKLDLALSKIIRVFSGEIDAPTLKIVAMVQSCGWTPKVGEKGIIFGRVRRSQDGTVFFYPSEYLSGPSAAIRERGIDHGRQ
jgi:hypothetical protein